ncbi:glycosyltransferase family 2 protein [Chitinophaga sp. 22536]|uniref:glycosyltransferase family 2 protein n=1 Tax=unclassified Chitinophaga TaxID=2619133 RepID=UPI003F870E71
MDVSVVIPVYNSEKTIKNCIDSVLNQTYKKISEVILVNDGSADSSRDIIQQIIKENTTAIDIKLIDQPNGGVSAARNAGLRAARGTYIALLDSDDEWKPEKLATQMQYFEKDKTIDFIGCNRNDEVIGFPYKEKDGIIEVSLRKLLFKTVAQTSTAVFKSVILSEVGYYDEKQRYAEDGNYWLRISMVRRMIVLQKSLVTTGGGKKNFGVSGLSANLNGMEAGVRKNINEMYSLHQITWPEFIFFHVFSYVKYIRRIVVSKINKTYVL